MKTICLRDNHWKAFYENDRNLVSSLMDTIDMHGSVLKYLNGEIDLSDK